MITAVDTNVLLDILSAEAPMAPRSRGALTRALAEGDVIAGDIVWAETVTWFANGRQMAEAMDRLGVHYEPPSAEAAAVAGRIWRSYRSEGGIRTRLMPDFLVAAHALVQADRLLSRDRGFFRRYFADLLLIDPSGP